MFSRICAIWIWKICRKQIYQENDYTVVLGASACVDIKEIHWKQLRFTRIFIKMLGMFDPTNTEYNIFGRIVFYP